MTPKTKDHCEMQISEINHWLTEIMNQRYGMPGTEIRKIYEQVKKTYAKVMITAEVERERLTKVASKNSTIERRKLTYRK